jgi:cytosine/adenosine deaminase-related metal-dependent hydrolase
MDAVEKIRGGEAQWAIVDTLYFDSALHSFLRADIEIEGPLIKAVLPPATSKCTVRLAGDRAVCLPGLIDPDVGPHHEDWSTRCRNLLLRGVTTAGTFCRSRRDCERVAGTEGIRCFCYVDLSELDSSNGDDGVVNEAWDRGEKLFAAMTSERCVLFPAIAPSRIWSAAGLLAAAELAERLARRVCVRLCATPVDAQRYKETRFFTELGLLSYLSLLSNATIFNLSQISRSDALALNDSRAHVVCAPGAVNEWLLDRRYAPLSLSNRAIGFSSNGNEVAAASGFAAFVMLSKALNKKSNGEMEACNLVADAMTHSAAAALGIADLGMVAANMKADLSIYDRPFDLHEHCGSPALLKLLSGDTPRHVLVNGVPAVLEHTCVREAVES